MDAALDIAVATAAGSRTVDLASKLVEEITSVGRPAAFLVDRLPALASGRTPCLVYPHEPLTRRAVANSAESLALIRRAIVACVGSIDPATAHVLRDARAVVALRPDAAHALRLAGLEPVPWAAGWAGDPFEGAERDLDVVVCEAWTPDRWRVVARCARVLDGRRCDLRSSYVGGVRSGVEHLPDGRARRALLRRARFALVVGAGPSLDVLAALEAAACGAVVVTDARIDLDPFVPGVHLLRADETSLPAVLDALLQDVHRESALRQAATALIRRSPLATAASQLMRVVDDPPVRPRRRGIPPRTGTVDDAVSPDLPTTARGLGAVLSEQRRQGRRLTRLERLDREAPRLVSTPAWSRVEPEISVVVPLYDYERYVEAACVSALAAREVEIELVVVDDASRDRGAERVEALIANLPDAPITLCRLPANGGLAHARNTGAEIARAPLLLFLDADDELLTYGPALLRDALAADAGAAFAYGLLAVEGPEGPRSMLNAEPWNPDLLREGNYINALSLVRAGAYSRIGGYQADGPLELGWEDYDFWLRMASAGLRGAHAREFVARYRAHERSRTSTADAIAGELMEYLRGRYPSLLGSASE